MSDDINELKVLAYDQLVLIERAQSNLNIITAKIAELEAKKQEESKQ